MLWLVKENESHQIISCNIHGKDDTWELWVTRPNGKSLLIQASENKQDVTEIKEAIDYAIENGIQSLKLD